MNDIGRNFDEYKNLLFSHNGWQLDYELAQKRGWASILILDYPDKRLIDRICHASEQLYDENIILVYFGGDIKESSGLKLMAPSSDDIYSEIFNHSYQAVYLTTQNVEFVFFKSDDNAYCVLACEKEFMEFVIGDDIKKFEKQFFDSISTEENSLRQKYLGLWDIYSSF